MILVTGGTGFIGQVLIRHLVSMGLQVRTLLRPSSISPDLPRGVPVEAVICGLKDTRGLRAALKGVDVVFHLAGAERKSIQADLFDTDVEGTRSLASAAAEAGVDRFFYLSHLGADRNSTRYTVLQAKAIAEGHIIRSGVDYTIFRSAVVYGSGDQFTTELARLLRVFPGIFLLPAGGDMLLQPLWIEDLVTCLILAMEDPSTARQTYRIGGPEYLTFRQIIEDVMAAAGIRRMLLPISPAVLRKITLWLENSYRDLPLSIYWQDYLAADRICDLDTLPRLFGLMPVRFSRHLDHLRSDYQGKTIPRKMRTRA